MKQTLKQWLISALPDEIQQLADGAGTSKAYLYQIATGRRKASACTAGAIVDTANTIRGKAKRLPVLHRVNLCEACSMCPHARMNHNTNN